MKKGKINNSTKNKRDSTKVVDLYTDLFTFREMPVSEALVERVMKDAHHKITSNHDCTSVSKVFREIGVSWQTVKRWRDKFPFAQEYYDEIMQAAADNRQEGALRGKYNSTIVMASQPLYDKDWRELVEWRAKLKTESASQGNVTVIMQPIDKSEMVPDKGDDDV